MKKQVTTTLKKRIILCSALFSLALVGLIIRLGYVQIAMGSFLQDKAYEQHTRDRLIAPTRGTIYDRTGKVLARSGSVATIGVVHAQIEDPAMVAKILSEKLEMKYEEVYKKVTKRVAFERIKTKVDKEVADEIRNMNLPGVKVDEDSKRFYPFQSLAAQVIGFVGKDNQGIVGLEVQYDSYLKGTEGKILMETNGKGERRQEEVEVRKEPENGTHLVTSLDVTLQQYAEQAIEKVVLEKQAKRGTIVLMNPQNGEIYSMANYPTYDLNDPFTINDEELLQAWHTYTYKEQQDYLNQMWRNFTINDTYEPGSTFKVFTAAMGLEQGVITPESEFNCNGSKLVGGRTIKCWRSPRNHGHQTFVEGVQNSCNPVFMEVGERLGTTIFHNYMIQYRFKQKTGIDLPGEAVGIMYSAEKMGPVELATMSFGQSFQITPLQLLTSASAVINGGYVITPHIGKAIVDDGGNTLQVFEYDKGEQIISSKTSEQMKSILESVVSEGTGNKAYIPGYRIGGKTATSQKLPRGSGKYIASFLAFAPAENPQVIALVLIDEPKGVYYGGAVAGPVMKDILANALPYLGVEPVYTEAESALAETQEVTVPDFRSLTKKDAQNLAYTSTVLIEFIGSGEQVISQLPMPGEKVNKNSKILLYTE